MIRSTANRQHHPPRSTGSLRRLLDRMIFGGSPPDARRGRLLLESLEKRQMMAGDTDLLFTDAGGQVDPSVAADHATDAIPVAGQAEGEPQQDLVAFAQLLASQGVEYFGAAWCPFCTEQKELFEDGGHFLPFIEVTNPDRSLNQTGIDEDITTFPTWKFPDGTVVTGVQTLEELRVLANIDSIPTSEQPTFVPIGDQTVRIGSPLHIPIDGYDPNGGPLTVTVSIDNDDLVEATVLSGNRSMRIDMVGWGDMVFQLFEQRAPGPTARIIELATAKFYNDDPLTAAKDGLTFHRVVDNFVIQGGDPAGDGTGGSDLPDIDDQFHPDLQHNRSGVLSYAKGGDDTNNSQFFITELPTRHLDFNHSILGQLVEGDDVREAISETAVSGSRPTIDVMMESVTIFDDLENSVVMLKALGSVAGSTQATITIRDLDGNTHSETITISVVPDTPIAPRENENSQPFLNPIATPAATDINTVAQLQLSSIDIEGDAVTYFAQSLSGSNGAVTVNPTSGLVSVTPANGFTGTIDVLVGVRRANPNSFQTSDQDTQRVSFLFEGEDTVPAPMSVDLQTASDTGSSNIDNITNAGSLSFFVDGVVSGATVELVNTDNGSVLGVGTATSTSTVITTNNIAALGDGTYSIAARQRVGNDTSAASPPVIVTYDTTAPESFVASAQTNGNVARQYRSDLISPEEGGGVVYELTVAPDSATINPSTGVIEWLPLNADLGDNTFSVRLTDSAGNSLTESFVVAVADMPLAEIRIDLTDLQGNPISSIGVGEQFLMRMVGVDARLFNKPGVFAAYADILFDNTLVRPVPGSAIEYSNDFEIERKGTFQTGLINELGAVSDNLSASNEAESLIATVRMEALASGTVNIRSEPADESDSDVLLFFEDNSIPAESVFYGNRTLAIGQNFTVGDDAVTVLEDSGASVVNVLANDQVLSGTDPLVILSVTQPAAGGTVSLTDGVVRFTPAAHFNGISTFTYRVSGAGGVQQDANVTVTVTAVNDPPTALNDTFTIDQDSTNNTLDLISNDSISPDVGESLTITAVGATSSGGTVAIAGNGQSVSYTPASGFVGTETFTYTVSDGGLTDIGEVTITVAPTDDPPTAVPDAFTVTEDSGEATFDVTGNDTRDGDNQEFTLSAVGTPSQGGTARISNDGTELVYRPAANFSGTEQVTYTIRDTGGGVAVGTVTFTVTPVNDAPPSENPNISLTRGGGESLVYEVNDLPDNPDAGETLTFSNVVNPTTAGGSARIDTTGQSIFYTPPSADFTGEDTFTYTVDDGSGLTSTGTIRISVVDYTERDVVLTSSVAMSQNRIGGIFLRGTDLLGNDVDVPLNYVGDEARFEDLLPGSYMIEIPAIPFLQNGSEPRQIPFVSAADDGDATIDSELGRIRPEYISIQDWLGSAPRENLLVAVVPGQTSVLTIASPAVAVVENAKVDLNDAGDTFTIQGIDPASDGSTPTEIEASIPASRDAGAQLRAEVDGMRLYVIAVNDAIEFGPQASGAGEGEAIAPAAQAVQVDAGRSAELGSAFVVGDQQSEGEAPTAAAITRADIFVPVDDDRATLSDAVVLPTAVGELWIGDRAPASSFNAANHTYPSVDAAIQSVVDQASESAGEELVQGGSALDEALVDQVLGGGH